ncbi:hypothetical protein [Methylovirgula sp. 4M-Z18]|uniref:hypothetical protein n=1 Tax=Methylovirgula sp. 4M-Z18 TaxID=2293567 RepID=UPI000E2F8B97|nr:hypothetical protein [Methylovirgula sp. 4M-Z18]RFB76620.1 hypothetical protein DYH55_19325 [Methylovirgula sp. 4M-Z18]
MTSECRGKLRSIFRRGMLLSLGLLSVAFLSACTTIPVTLPGDATEFSGISDLLARVESNASNGANRAPLRILIVHGIGTTSTTAFDPFIASLARRQGLVQVVHGPEEKSTPVSCTPTSVPSPSELVHTEPKLIGINGVPPSVQARLYTYDFAVSGTSQPIVLSVTYLYWAPLTEALKCNLYAHDENPPQWFASQAKNFIDFYLGDAVLYAGRYRDDVMRPSVQAALCLVVDGRPSSDGKTCSGGDRRDPTVLISHSLGGFMLMDAINEELYRGGSIPEENVSTPAYKILQDTRFIFMMANQLALLDLSNLTTYPSTPSSSPQATSLVAHTELSAAAHVTARRFLTEWGKIQRKRNAAVMHGIGNAGDNTPGVAQLVAFTDPDDVLSWRVEQSDIGPDKVNLTNVYMPNGEFSIPGLVSDPVKAHTGYSDNPTVLDLMLCGMDNGKVGTCAQNVIP